MKELWKKIDRFMLKYGGYSLLIATVATVAFFAVLQWAQDYVKEKTPELEIQLDDEGYLYVNYQYDDKENVYIFWETDGGSLSIENKDNTFSEQKEYQQFNQDIVATESEIDTDKLMTDSKTVRLTVCLKCPANLIDRLDDSRPLFKR